MSKNPHYWNRESIHLNEIEVAYITSDNRTRLNLFRDGQIAFVRMGAETVKDAVAQGMRIRTFLTGGVAYVWFNLREGKPTANKALRQAIQASFNPDEYVNKVIAIPGYKPTGTLFDPNVYFPGTEALAPDEMRLVACGTGMPTARESQAASCWLLELGNGDKFLFDGGTGSAARIASLNIPYEFLNTIFLSHLHTDHFGDFSAYFVGGWLAGRQGPLHVYGPSGARPETGTKYAIEHWQKAVTWDVEGRAGRLPASGGKVVVHGDRTTGHSSKCPLLKRFSWSIRKVRT